MATGLVIALCVAVPISAWLGCLLAKRRFDGAHLKLKATLARREESLHALREEQVDDKKVNRQLRYQLATKTGGEASPEYVEIDAAITTIARLQAEVDRLRQIIDARDSSLREARFAIQEVRRQIEVQASFPVD